MSGSARDAEASVAPVPRRYWWLKRLSLAGVGFVLLVVLLRLAFGWYVDHQIQAFIDAQHARGEPILPEDFRRPPIPDDQNAAVVLRQAFAAMDVPKELEPALGGWKESVVDGDWQEVYMWPSYWDEVARLITANAEALRLARKARGLPQANWGSVPTSPVISASAYPAREIKAIGQMSKLMAQAVAHYHHAGNDSEAVETLRDMLAVAAAARHMPWTMAHLIADATAWQTYSAAAKVAPELSVGNSPWAKITRLLGPRTGASRRDVSALIADMVSVKTSQAELKAIARVESMFELDVGRTISNGTASITALMAPWAGTPVLPDWFHHRLLGPWYAQEALRLSEGAAVWPREPYHYAAISTTQERQAAEVVHVSPLMEEPVLGSFVCTSLSYVVETHFRSVATRRLVATALAMRLHEIDHGRLPETLADMVPDYLPYVPADPFSSRDEPIIYCPDVRPPVLRSRGENGIDDGLLFDPRLGRGPVTVGYYGQDIVLGYTVVALEP